MASYELGKREEIVDVIRLTKAEFDSLNNVYRSAIKRKIPRITDVQINDMDRIVLTDGTLRIEFLIEHA